MIYQIFISNSKSEIFISNSRSKFFSRDLFYVEGSTPEDALERLGKAYCNLNGKQKLKEVYSSFKFIGDCEHEVKGVILRLNPASRRDLLSNNPHSKFLSAKDLIIFCKRKDLSKDLKNCLYNLLKSAYFES